MKFLRDYGLFFASLILFISCQAYLLFLNPFIVAASCIAIAVMLKEAVSITETEELDDSSYEDEED